MRVKEANTHTYTHTHPHIQQRQPAGNQTQNWLMLFGRRRETKPVTGQGEEVAVRECGTYYNICVCYICSCSLVLGLFCMLINYFQDFHSDM